MSGIFAGAVITAAGASLLLVLVVAVRALPIYDERTNTALLFMPLSLIVISGLLFIIYGFVKAFRYLRSSGHNQ